MRAAEPPGGSPAGDLMPDVRAALRSSEPLDLLALASSLLSACDPRGDDPFGGRDADAERPHLADVIESFLGVDRLETTGLLAVLAALLPPEGLSAWPDVATAKRLARDATAGRGRMGSMPADDIDGAFVREAVAARRHRLPEWLVHLDDTEVGQATEMVHVLGDGDNVIVGLRIPPDHHLTVVVYIDHNLGHVVKDAFVVPTRVDELLADMRRLAGDPDTEWRDVPLADAGARIADAVESGARTWPPFETDTWPACRPVVEWMLRKMPAGATVDEPRMWTDEETAELAERFLGSPEGARHRSRPGREMLDALLWYGTSYGKCDPLRWSPVSVEIVLTDWVPRKVMAPLAELRLVPSVLRDLVRFGHRELAIRQALTDETLEAVDTWESAYLALVRQPRPQGVDAIVSAVRAGLGREASAEGFGGVGDDDVGWDVEPGDDAFAEVAEIMLDSLARDVGGADVLRSLDDRPLPDEPLDASRVPDDLNERVREIADLCDGWYDELRAAAAVPHPQRDHHPVELRTATRRLLALVADHAPEVLRRRASSTGTAAALCWAVASANHLFDNRFDGPRAKDLSAHFGMSGSPAARARSMMRAAGFEGDWAYGPVVLPPALLTSARRASVIRARDRYLDDL